jgi:hypothetical protein
MATDSSNSGIFSLGSSLQNYNPITSWFRSSLGQFGFVNVQEMQSPDPDMERRIVTEVASYGKQLCRVFEALKAVCEHLEPLNPGGWAPAEREAVKSFLRLAEEIDAFKRGNQPVTQGTIDELVAVLRSLREQDRESYERVQQGLRAG